jgi:hypothetical protein
VTPALAVPQGRQLVRRYTRRRLVQAGARRREPSRTHAPVPTNWYSAWLPNSEAPNRKPVLSTQTETQGGMVSKYLTLTSLTVSPSYASVTL